MKHYSQPLIRIAIADSQRIVREGICTLITSFGGFAVDIEASDGEELIRQLQRAKKLPDICVFDITMPRMNGYETLKEIKAQWPDMKALIFTMVENEHAIMHLFKNRANGYLSKNCDKHDLKKSLEAIYSTGHYYSELTSHVMHEARGNELTDAEMRFLSFIHRDCDYKEIAEKMAVSPRTVDGYRDALFDKLQVSTRTGLVMYAVSMGMAPYKR